MNDDHYLILAHCGAHYAVPAEAVREVVWRPWLTPFAEMPPYVAGLFNLRGRIVPVIDLELRLGHPALPPRTQQRVVVLALGAQWVGLLVEDVAGVSSIEPAAVEAVQSFALAGMNTRFLSAGARLSEGLVWMLDLAALVSGTQEPAAPDAAAAMEASAQPLTEPDAADAADAADAEENDEALLRQRAARLAQQEASETQGLHKMAVLRLGNECFGLDVAQVRSFVHLRGISPAPGAPIHIAGHMNLHGELLTVVDIRHLLGVPTQAPGREVAVVQLEGLELGLLAEAIEDIAPLPAADAVAETGTRSTLCRGVVWHQQQAISLLDTPALHARLLEGAAKAPLSPAIS